MKTGIKLLVIGICVMSSLKSSSQDCMSIFRESYENLRGLTKTFQQGGVMFQYGISTESTESEICTDEFTYVSGGGKTLINSQGIQVYQDDATIVAIQESNRSIFITRSPKNREVSQEQVSAMFQFQDSILMYLVLKDCSFETISNNTKCRKLRFTLSPRVAGTLGISEVIYWVNEPKRKIEGVKISYSTEGIRTYKSLTYWIRELKTAYKEQPFKGPAISLVLDKNVLKKQYAQYTLIDERK